MSRLWQFVLTATDMRLASETYFYLTALHAFCGRRGLARGGTLRMTPTAVQEVPRPQANSSGVHQMEPTSDLDFVRILQGRAERNPTEPAYTFLHEDADASTSLTYAELYERVCAVATHLQKVAAPGDRVLLLYPPGLEYVIAFYACLYSGVIAVPLYAPQRRFVPVVDQIAKDCAPVAVCSTTKAAKKRLLHGEDSLVRNIPWLASDALDDPGNILPAVDGAPDQIAYLQYTSGSTGTPKGVVVDQANALETCRELIESWHPTTSSRMVTWLPHFHDFGQVGAILLPLYVGYESVLMAPAAFVQRPIRWLRAISRLRGTHTAAPNFAFDLCVDATTEADRADLDLSSLVVASNGAEPVRIDTLRRFHETFAKYGLGDQVLCPGYGLAEATLKVTSNSPDQPFAWGSFDPAALGRLLAVPTADPGGRALVGCGPTTLATRVVIVDGQTRRRLPDGQVGEIWVSGPVVPRGYWGRPEETKVTFGGRIEGETGGPYLRTGDLGFLGDGELYICGRDKDMIIVNGTNHYPQDIERTVEESHPSVRRGRTAAFAVEVKDREQVVVVVECARGDDSRPEEVAGAIREGVSRTHALGVTIAITESNTVPLTSSGKIQRQRCRSELLEDRLPLRYREEAAVPPSATEPAEAAPQSPQGQVFSSAAEVLRHSISVHVTSWIGQNVLDSTDAVDQQKPLSAHGISSLHLMELHSSLEDWAGMRLPAEWMWDSESIAELAHLIASQVTGPVASPNLTENRAV